MMRKFAIVLVATACALTGTVAFAAVPLEITTMYTDLTADAATLVGLAVVLAVAAFAALWVLRFAKKAARAGS